jgi:hypothetical protein
MRATDLAIRRCIDQFADDLIEIAEEQIREQVAVALSRIKTPPARARGTREGRREKVAKAPKPARAAKEPKAAKPPKAPKPPKPKREKLTALEKLERAQARRQERAEAKKRERQLALPFAGEGAASSDGVAEALEPKPRGRRKATAEGGEAPRAKSQRAPAPAAPPPLFVVKRTRDGNIQAMQRKAAEEAAAAQAEAAAQPSPS